MIEHLNELTFDACIAEGVTLVDFFATWCGPCKMFAPTLDRVAQEMPRVKVRKVDVDEAPALADRFGITVVPTVILFQNGAIKTQFSGLKPYPALQQMITNNIA